MVDSSAPIVKDGRRNRAGSTMGCTPVADARAFTCFSHSHHAVTSAAASTSSQAVPGTMNGTMRLTPPAPSSRAPTGSSAVIPRGPGAAGRPCTRVGGGSQRAPIATAARPTGTFMRNVERQPHSGPNAPRNSPPSRGPTATPRPTTVPKSP